MLEERYLDENEYGIGVAPGKKSCGIAAIDNRYRRLVVNGRPVMTSHLFSEGESCKERRDYRGSRRNLNRAKQRIKLSNQLLKEHIEKIDKDYFKRVAESALHQEDKTTDSKYVFFNDDNYTDVDYYKEFPTIHHLILRLMDEKEGKADLRLISIAVNWLLAHRGHFYSDISDKNIDKFKDFEYVYRRLEREFNYLNLELPWNKEVNLSKLGKIINKKAAMRDKLKEFKEEIYDGKVIPKTPEYDYNKEQFVKFLLGGSVQPKNLFPLEAEALSDLSSISITDDLETILFPYVSEYVGILEAAIGIRDWCEISNLLGKNKYISEAKVEIYETNKRDLKEFKAFVRNYYPDKYKLMFNEHVIKERTYESAVQYIKAKEEKLYKGFKEYTKGLEEEFNNKKSNKKLSILKEYVEKNHKDKYEPIFEPYPKKSVNFNDYKNHVKGSNGGSGEILYDYIKKTLNFEKTKKENGEEAEITKEILKIEEKMNMGTFLQLQVSKKNVVIPQQLHKVELIKILENASKYYPFFNEKDEDGLTIMEKFIALFEYKIDYFVGPLNNNSEYSWVVKKEDGYVNAWNYKKVIDFDASEKAFINRMTRSCTYLPEEKVLPKNSLLYCKYTVLNEINNIKINGKPISVETKQHIYNNYCLKTRKPSKSGVEKFLKENGLSEKEDIVTGLNDDYLGSTLKPYIQFKKFIDSGELAEAQIEDIIEYMSYNQDQKRMAEWLRINYPTLEESEVKYIAGLKYKDFGKLSKKLLNGIEGVDKNTGEIGTIIQLMWSTNKNLMQLLSNRYTFTEIIEGEQRNYYKKNNITDKDIISNASIIVPAKRTISRVLSLVEEIVDARGKVPKFIAIETGNWDKDQNQSGSRRRQLKKLYSLIKKDDLMPRDKELMDLLDELGDNADECLKSDAVYLFFLQRGKCMYSGEDIKYKKIQKRLKLIDVDIDHIYPQSKVRDENLSANKVLVLKRENRDKKDIFPIDADIQKNMKSLWLKLYKSGFITNKKYSRLTERDPLYTNEKEKLDFMAEQLVYSGYVLKTLVQILNKRYGEKVEIIYTKPWIVSDFRQEFLNCKSKIISSEYHAEDAYLTAVAGLVYYLNFTKRRAILNHYLSEIKDRNSALEEKNKPRFNINVKKMFNHDIYLNNKLVWDAEKDLKTVKNTFYNTAINITKLATYGTGKMFDTNLKPANEKLLPKKKGLDPAKYGGYGSLKAKGYAVIDCIIETARGDIPFTGLIPVDMIRYNRYMKNEDFRYEYINEMVNNIYGGKAKNIKFIIKRVIKPGTKISFDGFHMWLGGRTGKNLNLVNAVSFRPEVDKREYIRTLEKFVDKTHGQKNPKYFYNKKHEEELVKKGYKNKPAVEITKEGNEKLYQYIINTIKTSVFRSLPSAEHMIDVLEKGYDKFKKLSLEEQIFTLIDLMPYFSTTRAIGVKVKNIANSATAGNEMIGLNFNNSKYKKISIINESYAGLNKNETIIIKK